MIIALSTRVWLAVSGAAFAVFVLVRPWGDKTGDAASAAAAYADPAWVLAHSLGMLAWVAFAAALLSAGRWPAAWCAGIGVAALLPFYGLESFGLHGLARTVTDPTVVTAGAAAMREDPVAITLFGLGLLLCAAAALVVALRSSAGGPLRVATWVAAFGIATYLPQFFTPPALRTAHGLLLGAALVVLAALGTGVRAAADAEPVDRG